MLDVRRCPMLAVRPVFLSFRSEFRQHRCSSGPMRACAHVCLLLTGCGSWTSAIPRVSLRINQMCSRMKTRMRARDSIAAVLSRCEILAVVHSGGGVSRGHRLLSSVCSPRAFRRAGNARFVPCCTLGCRASHMRSAFLCFEVVLRNEKPPISVFKRRMLCVDVLRE